MRLSICVLTCVVLVGSSALSQAQTTTALNSEAAKMDALAAAHGQTRVTDKITSDFSHFLGNVDSQAVVTGLRHGSWTYTTPDSTGTGTTTTTVVLPTGKMGHGNVYTSLALAQHKLGQYGITQPTEAELHAALLGGSITSSNATTTTTHELQGVLTMRSDGMGWGQIAQAYGTKLGSVVSAMKRANHSIAATARSKGGEMPSTTGHTTQASKSGIVSAAGKSQGNSVQAGLNKNNSGQGIVTGSGKPATGLGHGQGGIVTGSGQAAGATSGITSAGGRGQGQAKGLYR